MIRNVQKKTTPCGPRIMQVLQYHPIVLVGSEELSEKAL